MANQMLNKDENTPTNGGEFINVKASNNLFEELKLNSYLFVDLLSELIDNSIAGRFDEKPVNIEVSFWSDGPRSGREISKISVSDDGKGISRAVLEDALSLASIQTEKSLHEHGMGMKVAVFTMGTLELLSTKTPEAKYALEIEKFAFGDIPLKHSKVKRKSGTEIRIKNIDTEKVPLKYDDPDGRRRTKDIKNGLPKWLGARYRMFLADEVRPGLKKRANITLKHFRHGKEIRKDRVEIKPVKPIYKFNLEKLNRAPYFTKTLSSKATSKVTWKAELEIGLAPPEQKEIGVPDKWAIEKPISGDPYHVSLKNQGIDLIMNDRVIAFSQMANLFRNIQSHNSYNHLRGELRLIEGFQTTTTKNAIAESSAWEECKGQVEQELKKFIKKHISGTLPGNRQDEKNASIDLIAWLRQNHKDEGKQFEHSQSTQFIGGKIDILNVTDKEVWELKKNKANWQDVFQLFGYLSIQGYKKGYLVANGTTDSCHAAINHINETYPQFHIEFKYFKRDFGISVPRDG